MVQYKYGLKQEQKGETRMKHTTVHCTYANGDVITTDVSGKMTVEQINGYFLGNLFNHVIDGKEEMVECIKTEIVTEEGLITTYQPSFGYKYIDVHVLWNDSYRACANGGITTKYSNNLHLFAESVSNEEIQVIASSTPNADEFLKKSLRVVYRENLDYVHCEPVFENEGKWKMAGGNFVYTSDSRYKTITNRNLPISVHDRVEA